MSVVKVSYWFKELTVEPSMLVYFCPLGAVAVSTVSVPPFEVFCVSRVFTDIAPHEVYST
jgi:hypothetical protein